MLLLICIFLNPYLSCVQFSRSVVSDSLRPYRLQHNRLPCPSPSPRAYSNSCPLSQRCQPTISSSVIPFSSCLPSFPASGSFPMSQLFPSGGQSIGASASASVLLMNIRGWFSLGLTCLISLLSKGLSRVFSSTTVRVRPRQGEWGPDKGTLLKGSTTDVKLGMSTADRGIHRPDCIIVLLGEMFIKIQIPSLYSGFTKSEETLELKESLFSKAYQVRPLQPGSR